MNIKKEGNTMAVYNKCKCGKLNKQGAKWNHERLTVENLNDKPRTYSPMYEYKTMDNVWNKEIEDILNDAGEEGWRLKNIHRVEASVNIILERELPIIRRSNQIGNQ